MNTIHGADTSNMPQEDIERLHQMMNELYVFGYTKIEGGGWRNPATGENDGGLVSAYGVLYRQRGKK